MSEGYQCDRCKSTHGGSPNTMLLVGDGRKRTRRGIAENARGPEFAEEPLGESEFDLCPACRNDLRKWWTDGGGNNEDIAPNFEGEQ